MKQVIFFLLLAPIFAQAEDKTLYYYGEAQLTDLQSGHVSKERLLLAKSLLPSKSMIVEIACTKAESEPAQISPVYMTVKKDRLVISDSGDMTTRNLSGTGIVKGTAWNWEYLYFSMKYQTPQGTVGIEDWNFVAGKKLIARKQIFFENNPVPIQLWDVDTTEITKSEHDRKSKNMGCPPLP